jgi:hypothetical protein
MFAILFVIPNAQPERPRWIAIAEFFQAEREMIPKRIQVIDDMFRSIDSVPAYAIVGRICIIQKRFRNATSNEYASSRTHHRAIPEVWSVFFLATVHGRNTIKLRLSLVAPWQRSRNKTEKRGTSEGRKTHIRKTDRCDRGP